MVRGLPFSAGDSDSIPGQGTKISHAAGNEAHLLHLLSPCTQEQTKLLLHAQQPEKAGTPQRPSVATIKNKKIERHLMNLASLKISERLSLYNINF